MMYHRNMYVDGVLVGQKDVDWDSLREHRNQELRKTDFWALKDLTLTTKRKDYREFLRGLPQNFPTANEAADAWAEYMVSEAPK